ncbi:MAG: hypothetical protein ABR577_00075 [Pyrinomonadaceae bacterium]
MINVQSCLIMMALILLLLTSSTAREQQLIKPAQAAEKIAVGEHARFEELRKQGFDALYNLDYDAARRDFSEMARAFPDHPAGAQFLAASLWVQTLNDSRRLQSSLYNTQSFYAKTEENVDPRIIEQFRAYTRTAAQLAKARLKQNPRDIEGLYFLGATESLKAAFAGAVERRFIAALRDGSSGVDRHREVLKLDPNYHDAEVSIGLYDYVVGGLPLPVKLLASIGGARGSKRRGIEALERVAREGRWAQDDAKVVLIAVLKAEGRYAEALTYARELSAKYTRNYLFKLEAADALVSVAKSEQALMPAAAAEHQREAFTIFDALLATPDTQSRKASSNTTTRSLDQIHFAYGVALFAAEQFTRAAKEFQAAANVKDAEAGLATTARLRAAQSLDLAGRRNDALAEYRAVLARPNVYDSQESAKRGLREAYRNEKGK